MRTEFDVLIAGGGAAGMMAAIAAAEQGVSVGLLEPNGRLGKKLNITGKGRCNLTNNCSREDLLAHIPCNGKFLYSAFSQFDSQDTMAFFENLGVPLKTERGNRVFPQSDRAFDVSAALERRMRELRVRWLRDRASWRGGYICRGRGGGRHRRRILSSDRQHRRRLPLGQGGGPHRHSTQRLLGAPGGGGDRLRSAPGAEPSERGADGF